MNNTVQTSIYHLLNDVDFQIAHIARVLNENKNQMRYTVFVKQAPLHLIHNVFFGKSR